MEKPHEKLKYELQELKGKSTFYDNEISKTVAKQYNLHTCDIQGPIVQCAK